MVLSRWQRLSEWPLVAAAVIFTLLYAWVVITKLGATYERRGLVAA